MVNGAEHDPRERAVVIKQQLRMTAAQYRETVMHLPAPTLPPGVEQSRLPKPLQVRLADLTVNPPIMSYRVPRRMNKTEEAYDRHLRYQQMAGVRIAGWYFEPCKWELPHSKGKRNTFTPDFLVRYEDGSEEWIEIKRAWRVKGQRGVYRPGFQGDGRTKLVTFAGTYPHLRVVLRWFHPYHSTWEEEVFNGTAV